MEYDWDAENIEHIALHEVSVAEVEEVLAQWTMDMGRQDWHNEERYEEVGMTSAGRILAVITTWRGDHLRVVTSYEPSAEVRREYHRRRRLLWL